MHFSIGAADWQLSTLEEASIPYSFLAGSVGRIWRCSNRNLVLHGIARLLSVCFFFLIENSSADFFRDGFFSLVRCFLIVDNLKFLLSIASLSHDDSEELMTTFLGAALACTAITVLDSLT